MPLLFNGVTIPEGVANAFQFNGSNITDVFMNGTQVWNQSLFSAIWSGSSLDVYQQYRNGFDASGNLIRAVANNVTGAWITMNITGLFTAAVSSSGNADRFNLTASGNGLRHSSSGGWCYFNIGAGWTGSSSFSGYNTVNKLETSGGLIRVYFTIYGGGGYGALVSLT